MENRKIEKKDFYFAVGVVVVLLIKRLMISHYGINREGGGEFESILSILNGKMIYRDFFWYLGFLPLYLNAILFKLFSPEIGLIRLSETCFALVGVYLAYKISRFFLSPALAFLVSLLAYSGMVIPVHVSGQLMAITIQIASIYYLFVYLKTDADRALLYAGLFSGLAFLFQIFPLAVVTFFGGIMAIICFAIFDAKTRLGGLKYFLLGSLPVPIIGYGMLTWVVPLKQLYQNLFPMFTGFETHPTAYSSFPFPSLFPQINFQADPGQWITALNRYLVVNLRWWMIVIVFLWGLAEFFWAQKNKSLERRSLLMLGTLVLFCPLFEIKFLIYLGRLGLTPSVINMLPTYILFFYLISLRLKWKPAAFFLAGAFLLVYFVYPVGKYYWYFVNHAVPLNIPYTKGIRVSPYKKDLYEKVHDHITQYTRPGDFIVVAGINRYFSALSGRPDLFQDNFLTFLQTPFYPSRRISGFMRESDKIEQKIIDRIRTSSIKLILVPEIFRQGLGASSSLFLRFLDTHWKRVAVYGDPALKNPYDWESPIGIYRPLLSDRR